MVCLFSYGSSLVDQSINFPPLRSFMNVKDRVHPFVPVDGITLMLSAYLSSSSHAFAPSSVLQAQNVFHQTIHRPLYGLL